MTRSKPRGAVSRAGKWLALKPGVHEGYLDWERAEAIRRMGYLGLNPSVRQSGPGPQPITGGSPSLRHRSGNDGLKDWHR
jgi:hypothetical protein